MKIDSDLVAKYLNSTLKFYEIYLDDSVHGEELSETEKLHAVRAIGALKEMVFNLSHTIKREHPKFNDKDFRNKAMG